MTHCPKCKHLIHDEANFCPYCMQKLNASNEILPDTPLPFHKKRKITVILSVICLALIITIAVIGILAVMKPQKTSEASKNIVPHNSASIAGSDLSSNATGNSGKGTIVLLEHDEIYINIQLVSMNSNAMWDISIDQYFRHIENNGIDDSINFMNTLNHDYNALKAKMGADEDSKMVSGEIIYYYYPGITIITYRGIVFSIEVDYSVLDYEDKLKYNFSTGINGLAKYKYIANRFNTISQTIDRGELHITEVALEDDIGSTLTVTYEGDTLITIVYECSYIGK